MKKTLVTLTATLACVAAFAQGKIQFGNDSVHYFVIGNPAPGDTGGGTTNIAANSNTDAPGAIRQSPLPSGISLAASLYGKNGTGFSDGAQLDLQTSYVLSGANWLQNGRMANKSVTLPTVAGGQTDTFDIYVYDASYASPFLARTAGAYFGESGLFTATPGTSFTFPSDLPGGPASSTWAPANLVISVVPEPASFALAGLGAAALLIFRRRK